MATKNTGVAIPEVAEILKTGIQFGHNTSRWNPRMSKYIFDSKNGIHVVDVIQTRNLLEEACEFLSKSAATGEVLFVATKRQAADIVRQEAIRAGAHFVVNRWPGGLLTNFQMVEHSIKRLNELERLFSEGVEGRTKYEVSRMKSEWERLDRLYGGVKSMKTRPAAIVVIDPRYEKVAVREGRKVNVPIVALTDTNCDPTMVDYIIPGNDDALGSIEMVAKALADAVAAGNGGKGVKHDFKDYSDVEVKIIRTEVTEDEPEEVATKETARISAPKPQTSAGAGKGILERAKESSSEKASSKSADTKSKQKKTTKAKPKATKSKAKKKTTKAK